MTPDERNILQPFLQDLAQARGAAKDPEAETMISQAVRDNPDAVYLLVQHAILSDQALHAAQGQIQQMQGAGGEPQGGSSFLGGGQPPAAYGAQPPAPYNEPAYGAQGYGQGPGYGAGQGYPGQAYAGQPYTGQGGGPMQSNPMSPGGGLGGFLRSAGTLAAGVAGGDFLAQGLSNLFGGGGRDW